MTTTKKAHKIRIYPNKQQAIQFQKTFGCVRFYWNFLLNQAISNYQHKQKDDTFQKDTTTYANLKKDPNYAWLKEVEAQPLSQTAMDLKKAYNNTFKSKFGFPKFKSKKRTKKSYRTAMGIKLNKHYCYIAKVGWLKMAQQLRFKGKIMNVTISQTPSGKYFATFLVETTSIKKRKNNHSIGIDLGIERFCIDSNGNKVTNPHFFTSTQKKLKKEQRKLSKRREVALKRNKRLSDCKNYQKQKIKVARIHEKISNQRTDFLQKLSTHYICDNQTLCIESLDVKNMIKDKTYSKLISDVAWSEFVRQLIYKAKWYGRTVVQTNPFFPSSQICSHCGHNDGKKDTTIRQWTCPNCHTHLDRDINASRNILTEGLSGLA